MTDGAITQADGALGVKQFTITRAYKNVEFVASRALNQTSYVDIGTVTLEELDR